MTNKDYEFHGGSSWVLNEGPSSLKILQQICDPVKTSSDTDLGISLILCLSTD